MKNINEISALDYQVKVGEMKCNAHEIRYLLHIMEQMNEIICGQFYGDLNEEEQERHKTNLDYLEYFQNKYLYLPALRKEEKEWFEMLKDAQVRSGKVTDDEDLKKAREIIDFCKLKYEKAKQERVNLTNELDAVKIEKYSGVFF